MKNVYFCRNATKQLMRVLKIYKTTAVTHGFYVYYSEHFNLNLQWYNQLLQNTKCLLQKKKKTLFTKYIPKKCFNFTFH